jgi:hypothetical protein
VQAVAVNGAGDSLRRTSGGWSIHPEVAGFMKVTTLTMIIQPFSGISIQRVVELFLK